MRLARATGSPDPRHLDRLSPLRNSVTHFEPLFSLGKTGKVVSISQSRSKR